MKKELTPKYWVAYNNNTNDVILSTLFKYRQDSIDEVERLHGVEWEETHPHLSIELIEINVIKNKET